MQLFFYFVHENLNNMEEVFMLQQFRIGDAFYLDSTAKEQLKNSGSVFYNDDLAPTNPEQRSWGAYNVVALWVSMCFSVPTYMLAAGLISSGLNWWQAISNVALGNVIIMFVIMLNSNVGIRYGIPYPVFARLCFGVRGAMFAALARGLVGAGWFGINCWIGGQALTCIPSCFFPEWKHTMLDDFICFFLTIFLSAGLCYYGSDLIKKVKAVAAPILAVFFAALFILFWFKLSAKGYSFYDALAFDSNLLSGTAFWGIYLGGLTANMAFWSTLSLNIPDLSRFVRSQKEHNTSIAFSLPLTMAICSFIGIFVTGATNVLYGSYIWDPVAVLSATNSAWVIIPGALVILISTVVLNVAANMLATANDVSSLWPKLISFKMAVVITSIAGVAVMPWKLLSSASAYVFGWLGLYGVLLAPLAGIFVADYYLLKKRRIDLGDLYSKETDGRYWYSAGFNKTAFFVWGVAVIPALVGRFFESFSFLYDAGWVVGAVIALFLYEKIASADSHAIITEAEWQQLNISK